MQYAATNNKEMSMKRAGHVLIHALYKNTKNDPKK